ncbi:hypothetical protein DVR12_19740 [Chitinophaga silvatica]|uniref:Right handed beta helix domain-containing protein n=1 Tax=Chitinophaga silvatica TaxID=2282649 RepID=A0A3E1Y5F3_9BACT|nr:right-handed parallel beta-helix repeat-containing protein [Chitinophaga silvatica]RFS19964.1 hypothetical protein DVR12_19740 [Chitinophaga silvatica]
MRSILNLIGVLVLFSCSSKGDTKPDNSNNGGKQNTYYVAPVGDDINSGKINAPLRSVNAALAKALPGDTVMVKGGVYHERVRFPKSGMAGKLITLKSAPGEKAIIDGTGLSVVGWEALVTVLNGRYITIEGLDICNFTSNGNSTDPEGISITGSSNNITVKNCNIYNIKNKATLNESRSAHAIFVVGNATEPITDLVVTGCTIHDMETGTSENLTLAGNIDGFSITNNKIYHTENIGIIIAGGDNLNPAGNIATNYARNGVVSDNEVYNVSMSNSAEIWGKDNYGAIGIYVCGGAGTIIERNKVYGCDRGIGLVSESNVLPTKTCIVRNNFVYNCYRTGIYMGDYLNYTHGGTNDCYVVNNTLFNNNRFPGAFGEIEGELRLTENCVNNVIRNNLVYAGPSDLFVHKYTASGSGNIIDNNLYFTTTQPQWMWNITNGAAITDFASWQQTSKADAASIYGKDPLLISITIPDLHIQATSPAKNTGAVISEAVNGTLDIDGKPRITNGKISIGAQQ